MKHVNSLRVNLDMGKAVYARQIEHDAEIPETIVRTSSLPEELGRVEYLLSDKTGTLTKNGTSSLAFFGKKKGKLRCSDRNGIAQVAHGYHVLRTRFNGRSGRSTQFCTYRCFFGARQCRCRHVIFPQSVGPYGDAAWPQGHVLQS